MRTWAKATFSGNLAGFAETYNRNQQNDQEMVALQERLKALEHKYTQEHSSKTFQYLFSILIFKNFTKISFFSKKKLKMCFP